jgi:hypothetical protein
VHLSEVVLLPPRQVVERRLLMISECFNPSCRQELMYLREGRVIRIIREDPDGFRLEHFWLCGACHLQYDFCFTKDETLSIEPQIGGRPHRKAPRIAID